MSKSLWPHGLQPAKLPCPSPCLRVCPSSCPLNQWCHPTISSSVTLFIFSLQSFPVSGFFPVNWLFASGGQSIKASASASILPMSIQGWFPLKLTNLISLQSKELSRVRFSDYFPALSPISMERISNPHFRFSSTLLTLSCKIGLLLLSLLVFYSIFFPSTSSHSGPLFIPKTCQVCSWIARLRSALPMELWAWIYDSLSSLHNCSDIISTEKLGYTSYLRFFCHTFSLLLSSFNVFITQIIFWE